MKKCLLLHNAFSLFRAVAAPVVAALALTFFCSVQLSAQRPRISVQGTLKTANGASVPDGTQAVTFRLYDVKEGGTELWHEDTTVEVIAGIYSHYLGSVEPLNPEHFDTTLYLAVKVGSYELAPRVELAYSPYALSVAFAQTVVCSGALGDVKYSVLPPAQFVLENGTCWVPMNGDPLPMGTKLLTYLPTWTNLPDAGGAFVRAQEFPGGATRDPERNSTTAIATVQLDEFKSHTHEMENAGSHDHTMGVRGFQDADPGKEGVDGSGDGSKSTDSAGIHKHTINPAGGLETRPVNINLWVYIRIN
ncbi:MAG: hypothetical protein IPM98_11675 [Lewinellaceae bacterium]|nr:hypothetical protein [Lewinellaceae bacterium]